MHMKKYHKSKVSLTHLRDRVSLCSPDWLQILSPSPSISRALESQSCTTIIPGNMLKLFSKQAPNAVGQLLLWHKEDPTQERTV